MTALGHANLKSPQDIEVYIVNTNFTLRWSYPEDDTDVMFSAQYCCSEDCQSNEMEWEELAGCQNVTGTKCDFSSAITEYDVEYHVRLRAEMREDKSPWSSYFEMIPSEIAEIGPPEIELQSTNGVIKIKVSPPEANQAQKMWIDDLSFKYNLVIWENSSNAELRKQSIFPTDTINDLAPETTYCLRVQAYRPLEKEGLFGPIHCIKTTRKVKDLLCPTNVRVSALNMKFHLHWKSQYKESVRYTVQYLLAYLKNIPGDQSKKWLCVPGCENITNTKCNFTSIIPPAPGFYYLRVQAMSGYNRSCLSNEVKIDPLVTNEIGPPTVKVDISDVLLHIQIAPPGGSENEAFRDYGLSYRVLYWKNSSNNEEEAKMKVVKQRLATVSDLTPATLYCVKAQAFSEAYNKSSPFSKEECIRTHGDKMLPLIIIAIFIGVLAGVLVIAIPFLFFLYQAYNKIKYVFFPSCHPPSNIEDLGGQPFGCPYLLTEEPTENFCIIESIITEETKQVDFEEGQHSKQSSRDSGNYSNDDDNSGSKVSKEKELV
ncbi:PREDICTED: interferon alpha/beta receptor 1 [Tinamus guttatus]|uniref:interferon alpha/beta receptor 1 n=1 Tax=Tinamus guttatus TaxID=94827 RepID=UPI00052E6B3C|nr:PREDICTED: interferon alpha/beta receptor 1 [Tinamus guttatus]